MNEELFEMGWNDVLGNIRKARKATPEQKHIWCERVKAGTIGLPRSEPDYRDGAMTAATRYLEGALLEFKGPKWVREAMREKTD